ncbi:sensor histidine kinase RegB [Algirhabdus cladophorae]|uniref:sensor histidine kinase RegB n=1 Tax=Algirhabdus cladophorae TaxID=3377108 RepID=UPI003B8455D8
MSDIETGLINTGARADWIRLRTLILLRWVAIAGQVVAINVAILVYDLQLELGLCFAAISASIIANFFSIFVYPENKRLTESEAVVMISFDILQLGFLLFLTGGLHNPFALLLLAPATVAATALQLRSTLFLGALSLVLITLLALLYVPLRTDVGFILRLPQLFVFGFWMAMVIGLVFLAVYARRVSSEMHAMSDALLATQMALSREQKLTDLGGVVAAAAHELGTPLATITLVSSELMDELPPDSEEHEDASLIREQADRCREILQSMGRAGKDDLHLRSAPVTAVIDEAAEPHMERGKQLIMSIAPSDLDPTLQPSILRKPEIIHGVRNLVQNAVDFAGSKVWIETGWTDSVLRLRIVDDGKGFAPWMLGRLGDPFIKSSGAAKKSSTERPGYEGMGLGLFIAKTLLERSGAEITFVNAGSGATLPEQTGAVVEVIWPLHRITSKADQTGGALGLNQKFEI